MRRELKKEVAKADKQIAGKKAREAWGILRRIKNNNREKTTK